MSYTLNLTGYYNAPENLVEPITPNTTLADVEDVSPKGKAPVYNAAEKKSNSTTSYPTPHTTTTTTSLPPKTSTTSTPP